MPIICFMQELSYAKPVNIEQACRLCDRIHDYLEQTHARLQQYEAGDSGNQSLFAICAWVDEFVLNLPDDTCHDLKIQWHSRLAQNKYFKTHNGGNEFFDRLNSLDNSHWQIMEIYYLCLGLGFRGRYCRHEDEVMLQSLCYRLYEFLSGADAGHVHPDDCHDICRSDVNA